MAAIGEILKVSSMTGKSAKKHIKVSSGVADAISEGRKKAVASVPKNDTKSFRDVLSRDARKEQLTKRYRGGESYVESSKSNFKSFLNGKSSTTKPDNKFRKYEEATAKMKGKTLRQTTRENYSKAESEARRKKWLENGGVRKDADKIAKGKKTQEQIKTNLAAMDERKLNGGLRGIGTTGSTLFSGAKKHFLDPAEGAARRKSAYKGTFQAAAASAAGHAGIAALNGDDPWEAAKTGAVRGAKVGGGYQILKGATGANAGSIWGNVKHINATTKDLYRATTVKGREQLRKEGVSGSLSTLLSMESGVANNRAFFSRKANVSTAQAMNQ